MRFNRETKEVPYRWEKGRFLHEAMLSWLEVVLTLLQTWGLLWGSLAKAKGLINAEIGVKHSYTLKAISYVQKVWNVARGGILSLPDQEKTL